MHQDYIGCFKDNPTNRDLAHQLTDDESSVTIETCTKQCSALYYRWVKTCFYWRSQIYKILRLIPSNLDISFCYIFFKISFRYAGLQNGAICFCGTSYGHYGPGKCTKKCRLNSEENSLSICGGKSSNTVYSTGIKVPGPPSNLYLNQSKEDSLSISWTPFNSLPSNFVTGYHIYVDLNKSFDTSVRKIFLI